MKRRLPNIVYHPGKDGPWVGSARRVAEILHRSAKMASRNKVSSLGHSAYAAYDGAASANGQLGYPMAKTMKRAGDNIFNGSKVHFHTRRVSQSRRNLKDSAQSSRNGPCTDKSEIFYFNNCRIESESLTKSLVHVEFQFGKDIIR